MAVEACIKVIRKVYGLAWIPDRPCKPNSERPAYPFRVTVFSQIFRRRTFVEC